MRLTCLACLMRFKLFTYPSASALEGDCSSVFLVGVSACTATKGAMSFAKADCGFIYSRHSF
jgi:hypothetical protein